MKRIALLVACVLGLSAAHLAAQAPTRRDLKIAMIAKSSANFVFLSAQRGAEEAARTLSQRLGSHVAPRRCARRRGATRTSRW